MSEETSMEGLLDQLSKRQDQHIQFMNALEQIRWQFTSAFGIAAILSLFFLSATESDSSSIEQVAAASLILIVSVAGLVTQIRIVGLFWNLWDKILVLQVEESSILKEVYGIREDISEALRFPRVVEQPSKLYYFFTVHVANCLVFSSIIGLGAILGLRAIVADLWVPVIAGVVISFCILTASYIASMYFYHELSGKKGIRNKTVSDK